jgi:hypothetical protein
MHAGYALVNAIRASVNVMRWSVNTNVMRSSVITERASVSVM